MKNADVPKTGIAGEEPIQTDAQTAAQNFIQMICNLRKWGEPDPENDGEPFEPSDGVDDSHTCLMDLIDEAREIMQLGNDHPGSDKITLGYDLAVLFMQELLDSVETLTAVVDQYGPRTLADLMYLQSAILQAGFIDHYPGESSVLKIARSLPSGEQWANFIKIEYMPRPVTHSGGFKSISDDDLCSKCCHCKCRLGVLSECELDWPGSEDEDGYVQECLQFDIVPA